MYTSTTASHFFLCLMYQKEGILQKQSNSFRADMGCGSSTPGFLPPLMDVRPENQVALKGLREAVCLVWNFPLKFFLFLKKFSTQLSNFPQINFRFLFESFSISLHEFLLLAISIFQLPKQK